MQAKVVWKGKMSFDGSAESGFSLRLGTSRSTGGDEDGFRPMELFAIGLAGCTALDVISILSKKRQEVSDFEVQVQAESAAVHPRVFTSASIHYQVTGKQVDEAALLRALELSATRYCPAQAMLSCSLPIQLHYSIYEDEGESRRRLVKTGQYIPAETAPA